MLSWSYKKKDLIVIDIIMSVKKEYCDLIRTKDKIYEFRPRLPKRLPIKKLYIYEMLPTSALKYILIVDSPIVYPEKLTLDSSFGAKKFNLGDDKNKVAYPIISMYELKNPIEKKILHKEYNLSPPQSYVYIDTYLKLKEQLKKEVLIKIF